MGYQRPNFDDEWQGLEPEQPKQRSTLFWAGAGVLVAILLCVCLGAAYVAVQRFASRTETAVPPPPPQPTSILTPITTAVATAVTNPTTNSTTPPIAATATIPVTRPPTTSNVEASTLPAPPAIDGNLAEWAGAPAYESAYRVFSAPGWDGTDDLTAVWRLAWDSSSLYIAVEITDDLHVQTQTGNQIFRGDSVDMQFETNLARASSQIGPSNFQITFSPGDFAGLPPSAFRFQGTGDGRMLDAPGGHRITVAAQRTGTGYTLEAAIPWSDLNVAPTPGLTLGVALNANDNDTPGTAVQEVMKSHVSTRTFLNPTTWGTLTLR
jgi:hypothetical protein